jgi:hypothetical protein
VRIGNHDEEISMTRTSNLFVAAALAIATLAAAPAIAANSATDQAKPSQIKRTATIHHQHHALRTRENESLMPRSDAKANANANANVSNANASADRPVESLATQYGAVTRAGNASDPACKKGELVRMPDGMHSCQ